MLMAMLPKRDLVLIQADEAKGQTKSGLFIAEEWKTLPHTGTVLAVGPLVREVNVGDRVMFERYASIILEDGQRLCKESHCMATLEASK